MHVGGCLFEVACILERSAFVSLTTWGGFCHMPHADRVPKLDKQQRTMLQELGVWRAVGFGFGTVEGKGCTDGIGGRCCGAHWSIGVWACCAHIHDQDKQEESQVALRPQDHGSYEHCWLGGGCWLQPDGCRLPWPALRGSWEDAKPAPVIRLLVVTRVWEPLRRGRQETKKFSNPTWYQRRPQTVCNAKNAETQKQ